MTLLFILLPLFVVGIATIIFNHKLTDTDRKVKIIYSSVEVVAVLSFTMLLFLFGYLRSSTDVIILVLLIVVSMIGLYLCTEYFNDNYYEQLAIIFNALLFYVKTVLVFLFVMTATRYLNVWVQLLLSSFVVALVFQLSLWIEPRVVRRFDSLIKTIRNYDKYELIVVPFLLLVTLLFLLEMPSQPVGQLLNVHNHINYLVFDTDIPSDVNVNFEEETTFQLTIDDLSVFARDYYYNDNYVYIYVNDDENSALVSGRLLIYNRATKELLYNEYTLNQTVTSLSREAYNKSESQEHFIIHQNDILFFASDGIYHINNATIAKLSNISYHEAKYFFEEGDLYFLLPTGGDLYEKYQYDNEQITLDETIDLSVESVSNLQIVNAHLLEYEDGEFYYGDPTNIYNPDSEEYFSDGNGDYIYHYNTIYDPSSELFYQFDFENTHHQVLRIYKQDGTLYGYFAHSALHTWFISNSYNINTDIEYRIIDEQLTLMHVSNRSGTTTFTFKNLHYLESPLELPFYAHFSMTTFWIILLSIFIPFLGNEKFVTYVDYDTVLKKQDETI